jgi:hypothetical protein
MKLEQGDNSVRIVSNPYQFVVHWAKDSSQTDRKIKCAIKNCPLCKKGIKTQYRWLLGVIDRADGQPKLLEISSQIFNAIKLYKDNKKWGNVTLYDINIRRGPKGAQPLYTVMPDSEKGKITVQEQEAVDSFFEKIDMNKYVEPASPEEVIEKLGGSSPSDFRSESPAPVSRPVISESDFNFGDEEL